MSSSLKFSRVRENMHYETNIFCDCGLKAPICTTRIFNCLIILILFVHNGNGCEFFHWNDQSSRRKKCEHEDINKMLVFLSCEIEGV
nr:uncharacterized protein LOC109161479 [Ipomoea batatas]